MTEQDEIKFNVPSIEGAELEYIRASVESGHTSSAGNFSVQARGVLKDETGTEEVLLTTSCTAALELAAMLLNLEDGDTVVVPSFTFTTTALAFVRQGARILFCDIEPGTLGLDPAHLEQLLDASVRAVVVVHYAGVACDMAGIQRVLAAHPDVALIEDNAHGLFGHWQDQPLGSLGRFAAQSFHDTKNIICGEGGALLLNDSTDVDRARVLYDKGTNRQAFFLGQVDKYSWKDVGSSFGLADTLAAYLYGQLEQRHVIQAKRRAVFELYAARLTPPSAELGFRGPLIPAGADSAYHMFYVLLPDNRARDSVLARMREQGIQATFHYVPLHSSDAGRRFAARPSQCPVSEDISGRLLRLPFHNNLSADDIERVSTVFLDAATTAGAGGTR
ncbi:MAG: dTDP-4-amino-4,6-dideoxygalactose transaminase [Propionibacteriales bacterium]|nr:dTDP-4-amino-4,6-dideoxygalactose transaminase [Propionibacteriales bacterium]